MCSAGHVMGESAGGAAGSMTEDDIDAPAADVDTTSPTITPSPGRDGSVHDSTFIGAGIKRQFIWQWHLGFVDEYIPAADDREELWHIIYSDGDQGDLEYAELVEFMAIFNIPKDSDIGS